MNMNYYFSFPALSALYTVGGVAYSCAPFGTLPIGERT
jgi:hypothetical protein